ncbi:MAG: hypothetical protein JST89_13635 [Cyanobacteria bacterium SZAS-4]|nr:hypothetical protein [Cyanobacteria bacterium SZAS-4]
MQTPRKQADKPSLIVLPEQPDLAHVDREQQTSFDGGGGPPNLPIMKDAGVLWVFCIFGVILFAIGVLALSVDPATARFRQTNLPSFGDLRISCELLLVVVGTGFIFPSITCLRALSKARKVEKETDGRVKSLSARKLEKISDSSISGIMGNYIAAFLGLI